MSAEFDGFGFAVGSVKGIRAFRVDGLGRLTGIFHKEVWTPGENVASCKAVRGVTESEMTVWERLDWEFARDSRRPGMLARYMRPTRPAPCKGVDPNCACGYYAYYDGTNEHGGDGLVSGVIEGYGKTVIGTRGFRTEKAKILALHVPGPSMAERTAKTMDGYPYNLALLAVMLVALASTISALARGDAEWWRWTLLVFNTMGAAYWTWQVWDVWVSRRMTKCRTGPLHHAARECRCSRRVRWALARKGYLAEQEPGSLDAQTRAKIQRNYPDVPIFDDYQKMIEAFPPDRSAEPSPENDPEFWTRPIPE